MVPVTVSPQDDLSKYRDLSITCKFLDAQPISKDEADKNAVAHLDYIWGAEKPPALFYKSYYNQSLANAEASLYIQQLFATKNNIPALPNAKTIREICLPLPRNADKMTCWAKMMQMTVYRALMNDLTVRNEFWAAFPSLVTKRQKPVKFCQDKECCLTQHCNNCVRGIEYLNIWLTRQVSTSQPMVFHTNGLGHRCQHCHRSRHQNCYPEWLRSERLERSNINRDHVMQHSVRLSDQNSRRQLESTFRAVQNSVRDRLLRKYENIKRQSPAKAKKVNREIWVVTQFRNLEVVAWEAYSARALVDC